MGYFSNHYRLMRSVLCGLGGMLFFIANAHALYKTPQTEPRAFRFLCSPTEFSMQPLLLNDFTPEKAIDRGDLGHVLIVPHLLSEEQLTQGIKIPCDEFPDPVFALLTFDTTSWRAKSPEDVDRLSLWIKGQEVIRERDWGFFERESFGFGVLTVHYHNFQKDYTITAKSKTGLITSQHAWTLSMRLEDLKRRGLPGSFWSPRVPYFLGITEKDYRKAEKAIELYAFRETPSLRMKVICSNKNGFHSLSFHGDDQSYDKMKVSRYPLNKVHSYQCGKKISAELISTLPGWVLLLKYEDKIITNDLLLELWAAPTGIAVNDRGNLFLSYESGIGAEPFVSWSYQGDVSSLATDRSNQNYSLLWPRYSPAKRY